jgi:ABC-type multidrug transport system permease subunit
MATQTTRPTARHRLTIVALWVVAAGAFIGLLIGGYPTIGAVAFLGIGVASVGFWRWRGPLFDERDESIVTTASTQLVQLLGITSGIVFPTLTLLWGLGYIDWPAWLAPISGFVAVLFGLWVGLLLLARAHR